MEKLKNFNLRQIPVNVPEENYDLCIYGLSPLYHGQFLGLTFYFGSKISALKFASKYSSFHTFNYWFNIKQKSPHLSYFSAVKNVSSYSSLVC